MLACCLLPLTEITHKMHRRLSWPHPNTLPISCGMISARRATRVRWEMGEDAVTFEEVVDQALAMLQRRGRVTYRLLKRPFDLADEAPEDLKLELIKGQRLAMDEEGEVLVWTGAGGTVPESNLPPPSPQQRPTQDLHHATALPSPPNSPPSEAERRQLTVLFCDLVDSTAL